MESKPVVCLAKGDMIVMRLYIYFNFCIFEIYGISAPSRDYLPFSL